uniref:E2 ubiquitin-conjugating enzyme n=1 Tax=Chlamydomonas leiostraca TaxID=1034604 RepID=A0A7S0RIG9_9CHLO|mmetsp:Transcript_23933/g.60966  ORF Transcript_23933/g.60966 Transcript_23933/m.60966 type:complete len:193 (+) Transcript_23933:95-673(+)|eukprot:CAMPEP_0202868546 /NCGR_PEP_ID=MMETSP1391-20130828/10941_1 /ASSEMBLY_ACC=CAM_ASM_000867 /TAXON_ID=1034604 /ORGANISM="Chlamydomonas leiostraca, Strain SAG 11-49" /LENGTH=192 /DNA_ID=CAMNT_0049548731 /DNA_START=93 /DNA_END=671 /DNA_ORIENTATION=-
MPLDAGRVHKELKEIEKDKASGVTVELRGGSLQHLRGWVPGPKDTAYDGGLYEVDIDLGDQYPFVPPKMRFVTKVWHPNISSANGAICLDILKDAWSPALTLKTALLSLQALLSSPQPDDPQDAVVAKQYLSDYPLFLKTARNWTEMFAMPKSEDEKVARITEMGFSKSDAEAALKACNGDENAALEKLLSS